MGLSNAQGAGCERMGKEEDRKEGEVDKCCEEWMITRISQQDSKAAFRLRHRQEAGFGSTGSEIEKVLNRGITACTKNLKELVLSRCH
jgi:hypothetical protein